MENKLAKLESPCKKCFEFPCKEKASCELRLDYVKKLGPSGIQAVDMDYGYRLIL